MSTPSLHQLHGASPRLLSTMPARKRTFEEVEQKVTPTEPSLLHRIRNTWEFASLMQYLFFFGEAVKIDKDLDIDVGCAAAPCWPQRLARTLTISSLDAGSGVLEAWSLRHALRDWPRVTQICLFSQRPDVRYLLVPVTINTLTIHNRPEIFDEYTRRQYVAKAPTRNPFGEEEEPLHFIGFDVFTKLRVLHQLSVWTLNNPDRIREKMEEKEGEQTQWVSRKRHIYRSTLIYCSESSL